MSKATSALLGIEDEFDVVSVERLDPGQVKIIIDMQTTAAPCPACGVFTSRVKDRPVRRVRDLPASGQQTRLWWRKRRLLCVEALCPRRSFTQESVAIRPPGRVTERLRARVAEAIAAGNRAVSEVAGEYGVSWPTAHRARIAAGAGGCPSRHPRGG
jgi:transposase